MEKVNVSKIEILPVASLIKTETHAKSYERDCTTHKKKIEAKGILGLVLVSANAMLIRVGSGLRYWRFC